MTDSEREEAINLVRHICNNCNQIFKVIFLQIMFLNAGMFVDYSKKSSNGY